MTYILFFLAAAGFVAFHLFGWKPRSHEVFYDKKPLWFAHRGLLHRAPENTEAAYKAAVESGMNALEMDVVITWDGYVVCSHNYDLERKTNGFGYIDEKTYDEIAKVNAGVNWHDTFEPIPRLDEVLEALPEGFRINIELKTRRLFETRLPGKVVKIVRKCNLQDRVIVSSFNPLTVWIVKWYDPKILTGFILENTRLFSFVNWVHPDCLHPRADLVNERILNYAKKKGLALNVWTVNTRPAIQWLLDRGVDGIITDRNEHIDHFFI